MRLGEVTAALLCVTVLSFKELRCELYPPQNALTVRAHCFHFTDEKNRRAEELSEVPELN